MTARVPPPPDYDPADPIDRARLADREQEAFDVAWKTIRERSPGGIVRQLGRSVNLSLPGIEVAFDTRHLPALEAAVAMLRSLAGR